jgi:competence protein ComEC
VVATGAVEGLVESREIRPGQKRQRFQFSSTRWQPVECAGPRRLLLSYYGDKAISSSEQLTLRVAMRRTWGQVNPGSISFQAWYAFAGIDATGTVKAVLRRSPADSPLPLSAVVRQRSRLIHLIESTALSDQSQGLLKALVVGDKSGIGPSAWQRFQVLGINHLFVISGLHIGLIAALGFGCGSCLSRVLQLFRGPPALLLGPVFALLCAFSYAALAGFSLSTRRALLMTVCFLLAALLGRQSRSWLALLVAGLGVLLLNPLSMLSSGFWLSFLAVLWLLWLSPFLRPHSRIRRVAGLHSSLCLLMLPLTFWWFGGASVLSPLANFVFVPVVSLLVVPLVLFGTVLALLDLPGWQTVWGIALWPLTTLLASLDAGLGSQLSRLYWPGTTQLPEVALALAGLMLWPLVVENRSRVLLCLLFTPVLLPSTTNEARVRVSVLDVGQGTAVVVQAGHRTLLYDTGGGNPEGYNSARSTVMPFLRYGGVTRLDTLVVSHPDLDHSAGVTALLEEFPANQIYVSQPVRGLDAASTCRTGQAFAWPEGLQFRFLSPSAPALMSSNNGSCVLQVTLPNEQTVLLPGDIETAIELELVQFWGDELASDYALAAHHGSKTSTSAAWLKWVVPRMILVTHGRDNPFGHPHPDVVARVRTAGIQLESTAERGALVFEQTATGELSFTGWRQFQHYYWL